jgi:hypothetical protein
VSVVLSAEQSALPAPPLPCPHLWTVKVDRVGQLQSIEGINELLGPVYSFQVIVIKRLLVDLAPFEPLADTGLVAPAAGQ